MNTCSCCRWYVKDSTLVEADRGSCHVRPPTTSVVGSRILSLWAVTKHTDFCALFERFDPDREQVPNAAA